LNEIPAADGAVLKNDKDGKQKNLEKSTFVFIFIRKKPIKLLKP